MRTKYDVDGLEREQDEYWVDTKFLETGEYDY